MLTGDQLRMARALLRLSMRETAKISGIDPSTIVRIEAGENAYRLTLERLQQVLEERGALFIPASEGKHEPGVALRCGVDISQRTGGEAAAGKEDEHGTKAAPWDDFAEAGTVPPDIESLRTYWRGHQAEWATLAPISQQVLLREMQLDSLGGEARGQA